MVKRTITISRNLFIVETLMRIGEDRAEKENKIVGFPRSGYIFGLAGFVVLVTTSGLAQRAHDPWRIVASGESGSPEIRNRNPYITKMTWIFPSQAHP
jgi:hypothetical protein